MHLAATIADLNETHDLLIEEFKQIDDYAVSFDVISLETEDENL